MSGVSRARLIQMMVGRELSSVFPKRVVPIGETVLELRGLGCRAPPVYTAVTLRACEAGEIVGEPPNSSGQGAPSWRGRSSASPSGY